MNKYLVVCGIILNILLVLAIITGVISEIMARKYNKKKAAEKAWQEWAKKLNELKRDRDREFNLTKRLRFDMAMISHQFSEYYQFNSIERRILLYILGQDNKWVLQGQSN